MSLTWPVYWLDEIDSTNEEAKRRAKADGFSAQWIGAHKQVSGRGRLGRVWVSPKGNLYTTALFQWTHELRDMTRIPFAAALAVAETVEGLAPGSCPLLKWPNDVRCAGAKVSGILVEAGETNGARWMAVGIGINVGFAPEGLDQAATSLADLRGDAVITPQMTLDALRAAFALRLAEAETGFADIRKAWLKRAEGLGQPVRVKVGGTVEEGIFADMAADGALLLHLRDGTQKTIRAGDVELVREVSPE